MPAEGASDNVKQGVVDANFKNIAEAQAFYAAMMAANSVAHQKAMDQLREVFLLSGVRKYTEADIQEATAEKKFGEAGDLATAIAQLGTVIGALQQIIKGAQTTPPSTP